MGKIGIVVYVLYIYIEREIYILGTKRRGVVKVKWELSSFHSGREKVCATGWQSTIYKARSQIGHILEDFWPCLLEFLLRIKCWTCLQKEKNVRKGYLEGLLYYHFFAGWKKENLSFCFIYNRISKSRRFVSINGGFGSNPPSFLPLRKMGGARKLGGNTENHQSLEIVDVLYVKQHLQLQFHLSNDPSPGLVKAIELFDLVAVGVLKRLRTCTKIFLKPSCLACPSPQVILVEKGKKQQN